MGRRGVINNEGRVSSRAPPLSFLVLSPRGGGVDGASTSPGPLPPPRAVKEEIESVNSVPHSIRDDIDHRSTPLSATREYYDTFGHLIYLGEGRGGESRP